MKDHKLAILAKATIAFFMVLAAAKLLAQESNQWANWRGPNFDGSLADVHPPTTWDSKTNIKWKADIPGLGSGSPIIWDDQLIVVTAIKTDRVGQPDVEGVPPGPNASGAAAFMRSRMNNPAPQNLYQFAVLSFDRTTGSERWRTIVAEAVPHEGGHTTNTFASGSPVTDGDRIYVSFGSFGVYALDMQGQKLWSADLGKMTTRNQFGEASSPAIYGDTLIVPWDQDGYEDKNQNGQRDADELLSSLVALDARTGEIRWRTPRPTEVTTWATPLIVETKQGPQVITNGTVVRSYALEDGRLIWECGGQVTNPIPSPIKFGDSVICMTGYRGNAVFCMALDSQGAIDGTQKIRWSRDDAAPYISSATLYQGQLYLTKSRDGIMVALDANTGEVIIPETRMGGIRSMYASQVAAGDCIYFTGREGTTYVIRHGNEYQEVSINRLGEPVDASPAICGNELFIRAKEHLYCISEEIATKNP